MNTKTANLIIVMVVILSGFAWYNLSYKKNGKEIIEKIKTTKPITVYDEKSKREIDSLKREVQTLKNKRNH